jgi:tetratricopeptide (TPR) repeat protein
MQGKANEARATLKKTLKLYPQYAEARCELGFVSQQQRKSNDSRAFARDALKINHTLPGAYLHRGSQLMMRRLFAAARHDYEMALFLKPDYWQGYCNAGVLAKAEGSLDLARDYFERAYRLQPDSPTVITLLMATMLGLGEIGAVTKMRGHICYHDAFIVAQRRTTTPQCCSGTTCRSP